VNATSIHFCLEVMDDQGLHYAARWKAGEARYEAHVRWYELAQVWAVEIYKDGKFTGENILYRDLRPAAAMAYLMSRGKVPVVD
jgi:hypothetical protein